MEKINNLKYKYMYLSFIELTENQLNANCDKYVDNRINKIKYRKENDRIENILQYRRRIYGIYDSIKMISRYDDREVVMCPTCNLFVSKLEGCKDYCGMIYCIGCGNKHFDTCISYG